MFSSPTASTWSTAVEKFLVPADVCQIWAVQRDVFGRVQSSSAIFYSSTRRSRENTGFRLRRKYITETLSGNRCFRITKGSVRGLFDLCFQIIVVCYLVNGPRVRYYYTLLLHVYP
jgi:hypothetical protein